ncbi:hypothetical protein ACFCX4_00190 [Kitasatospora sp. NPDC056327]|uniref:hypothetical protein n=1 Tax=Kitasatospora sp. NPDC056327 TaxID=3345785 RepID=UPI0035D69001
MSSDERLEDEARSGPASPSGVQSTVQTNRADAGGTVNAVQNGDQSIHYFVGPDGKLLFTQWERSLRRNPGTLRIGPDQELTVDRPAALADLIEALVSDRPEEVIIVRGAPGVGKSALVLRAVDELRNRSVQVLAASLPAMAPYAGGLAEVVTSALDRDSSARGTPTRSGILVLDGSEAAQEGFDDLTIEAVDAALSTGLLPVLVSRDDAAEMLGDLVARAGHRGVAETSVPPLDDREVDDVLRAAPHLAQMADDGRSRWLLRRLKIIDLLLRSTGRGGTLPARLRSEADVYRHVWTAFVLNNGLQLSRGLEAGARGRTLATLAEARLTGRRPPEVPGPALASLRSDGILAPLDEASAVSGEEHAFSHDLLRDFATTRRLLLDDGFLLLEGTGPRWAVHAARIYCQERLWPDPAAPGGFLTRWNRTRQQFVRLAERHGARWEDVLWESVLSADWCADALSGLTQEFIRDPGLLNSLLRCTLQRFGDGGSCDPLVAGPVVEWIARHASVLSHSHAELGDKVVLAWLRGLFLQEVLGTDTTKNRPVRALLRDAMLRDVPDFPSAAYIEALALLGAERAGTAAALLRKLAQSHPNSLMPAVDRAEASGCLAMTDPDLLVELASAYYLPRPDRPDRFLGNRRRPWMGKHEFLGGLARSQANWARGPFFWLLQAAPSHGLRLIEAIATGTVEAQSTTSSELGLTADFLDTGLRHYAGAPRSWFWYRGALNGHQPCMSALMALERWLEREIACGSITVRAAAQLVLARVGTLSGLGLAYGLLLRHLNMVTDELDEFLTLPQVWELEIGRITSDSLLSSGNDLPGDEWLKRRPVEVAMALVIDAARTDNGKAVARLRAVADRLRSAAPDGVYGLTVKSWADHLDLERFRQVRDGDQVAIEVQPSEVVAAALERHRAEADRTSQQYALVNRYAFHRSVPYRVSKPVVDDLATLATDLRIARELHGGLADEAGWASDGRYAVAAAAVHAATVGSTLDDEDLQWSVDLLTSALYEPVDTSYGPDATQPWAGNRLAALALPRLLSPLADASEPPPIDTERVADAVAHSAAHPMHEVREYAVEGLRPLWSIRCSTDHRQCHHSLAWRAVESCVRQSLEPRAIPPAPTMGNTSSASLAATLVSRKGKDMDPAVLRPAVSAVLEAGRTPHCCRALAQELRGPLLDAYARAAQVWGEEPHTEQGTGLGASLLRAAGAEPTVLIRFADRLIVSPSAFSHLLRALKTAATYESDLVRPFAASWPYLMELVLTQPLPTAVDQEDEDAGRFARHDHRTMQSEIIPNPVVSMMDRDVDGTLREARRRWIPLAPVADLVEDWTAHVDKDWSALDNLIGFLKAQPVHLQVDPGLRWVRQLSVNGAGAVDTAGLSLVDWLKDLHPVVTAAAEPHFQAVVDGLALAQHPSATALQRLDE